MTKESGFEDVSEASQVWGVGQEGGQVAVYLARPHDRACLPVAITPAAAMAMGKALIQAAAAAGDK